MPQGTFAQVIHDLERRHPRGSEVSVEVSCEEQEHLLRGCLCGLVTRIPARDLVQACRWIRFDQLMKPLLSTQTLSRQCSGGCWSASHSKVSHRVSSSIPSYANTIPTVGTYGQSRASVD